MEKYISQWIKISWKIKAGALFLTAAFIGAIDYFIFYGDQDTQYQGQITQLKDLNVKYANSVEFANNLNQFKEEVSDLNQQLEKALTLLPKDREIPDLLRKITYTAEQSGLEVLLFKPLPEVPKGFYAEVPVELRSQGTYRDILVFFDKISKLSRIMNISKISFTSPTAKDNQFFLSANFKITTFRFLNTPVAVKQNTGSSGRGRRWRRQ